MFLNFIQDDRSLINLHLMHTSYFLFVMVITMFCYAVVKGRPGKVRQTNPDFCPEKVPQAPAGSVREVLRSRWRVVLCFRWRYRRAESVPTGEEAQRPRRLGKHTRDTQVLVCPTKDEEVPVTAPLTICRNFEFTFCLVLISARVVRERERRRFSHTATFTTTELHSFVSVTVQCPYRREGSQYGRSLEPHLIRIFLPAWLTDWDETNKLYHLYLFCLFCFLQRRLRHSPASSCFAAAIFSIFVVDCRDVSPEQNMILPYLYGDSSAYRRWQGFLSVFSSVCVRVCARPLAWQACGVRRIIPTTWRIYLKFQCKSQNKVWIFSLIWV